MHCEPTTAQPERALSQTHLQRTCPALTDDVMACSMTSAVLSA